MKHAIAYAESLGLCMPIFQAPVGTVAAPELAAAVSQAGRMGAVALTSKSPEVARRLVAETRRTTDRAFQANFVLTFESRSLVAVLESGVRIVCQGIEAGGHVRATRSLDTVLPSVLEAAKGIPVIAAGGIGDGKAVARVLAMGASGAMLGTRFVATQESLAHDTYKRRLAETRAQDTTLTVYFDGGWPNAAHCVLQNSTLEVWAAAGCPPNGRRPGERDVTANDPNDRNYFRYDDAPPQATCDGNIEAMCLYAGTSCEAIRDIPTVSTLMLQPCHEFELASPLARLSTDFTDSSCQ